MARDLMIRRSRFWYACIADEFLSLPLYALRRIKTIHAPQHIDLAYALCNILTIYAPRRILT